MQPIEETRTDIEELWIERSSRLHEALIERMQDNLKVKDLELQVNHLEHMLRLSESRYFNMNQQNKLLRKKQTHFTIDKDNLRELILEKIEEFKCERNNHKKLKNFIRKLLS